jgi:Sec-independent protein secretion pathway components
MFIPCAIGYGQILIIVFVVLLLFGGRKIPELMRGLGRGVKEFKAVRTYEQRTTIRYQVSEISAFYPDCW